MFYNCIEGEGTEIVCPNGLHFDEYAGTCAWPDTAGRTGCGEPDDSKLCDRNAVKSDDSDDKSDKR